MLYIDQISLPPPFLKNTNEMNCKIDVYFPSFSLNTVRVCKLFCTQLYRSCRATDKNFRVFIQSSVHVWELEVCGILVGDFALDQKQG